MLAFSKRLIYALSNKILQRNQGDYDSIAIAPEGKLTVDFARVNKAPFDIKSESSHNANLSNGSLELGLKKSNCIAWTDIPGQEYQDHVIEARYRLDSLGGYAAAGIIFHIMDEDSYYLALVSSKGYFRLDVIKENAPKTLVAWTDISDFNSENINMKIITYGACFIFIVNDKWLEDPNNSGKINSVVGTELNTFLVIGSIAVLSVVAALGVGTVFMIRANKKRKEEYALALQKMKTAKIRMGTADLIKNLKEGN